MREAGSRVSAQADEPLVLLADASGGPGAAVPRRRAHQAPGMLHVAVSVQIVEPDGRWLVQRRAPTKLLFGDRWANTCCTHPEPVEALAQAATRRIHEELGITLTDLIPAGTFTYRAVDPVSGLVEHEQDHVFVGVSPTDQLTIDPHEVRQIARLPFSDALDLVASDQGTPWAPAVLRHARRALETRHR